MNWLTDPYGGWQEQFDEELSDNEVNEFIEEVIIKGTLDELDELN